HSVSTPARSQRVVTGAAGQIIVVVARNEEGNAIQRVGVAKGVGRRACGKIGCNPTRSGLNGVENDGVSRIRGADIECVTAVATNQNVKTVAELIGAVRPGVESIVAIAAVQE